MEDLETDLKNQGSFLGLLISRTCECYLNLCQKLLFSPTRRVTKVCSTSGHLRKRNSFCSEGYKDFSTLHHFVEIMWGPQKEGGAASQ